MADETEPAKAALAFVQLLAAASEKLAQRGVVTRSLRCDWASFGSWMMEASNESKELARWEAFRKKDFGAPGPEVLRVVWDGKERLLEVSASPSGALTGPSRFVKESSGSFANMQAALSFAEDYLVKRLLKT